MRTIRSYSIVSGFLIVILALFKTLTPGSDGTPVVSLTTGAEYYDNAVYDINEDFYQVHSSNTTDFSYKVKVKLKIKKRFRARYFEYFLCPAINTAKRFKAACRVSYFHRDDYLSSRFNFYFNLRGPPVQLIR